MGLTSLSFRNFTAFRELDVELGPGINVFIGKNGTGKTHILKVAYAACAITVANEPFSAKLQRLFLPYKGRLGRLVHRQQGSSTGSATVAHSDETSITTSFSNHAQSSRAAKEKGYTSWIAETVESAYIPVKEMLANGPGFRSLYATRKIHFEEVYSDILDKAYLPIPTGPAHPTRKHLLTILEGALQGKVVQKEEVFFLKNVHGELEFTLLAEGLRKLGLLWLLIQNETLVDRAVLFWDEPEANLNPRAVGILMEVLVALQRLGVQILLATHDYVVLKELDLRREQGDKVMFHSLYRDEEGMVRHAATENYLELEPNAISETFLDLYDRDVKRDLA